MPLTVEAENYHRIPAQSPFEWGSIISDAAIPEEKVHLLDAAASLRDGGVETTAEYINDMNQIKLSADNEPLNQVERFLQNRGRTKTELLSAAAPGE